MAVAVDATGTEQNSASATSLAYTGITVGSGSNRALIVTFGISNGTAPTGVTATWDNGGTNQAMTSISSVANGGITTFVYGLRNPIAGNKTLQIAWTNTNEISACAISFTGVDQVSDATAFPHNNSSTGSSTTASLTITSASGNIPVTSMATAQLPSAPNQTQIYLNTAMVNSYGAQRAAGSASVSFTWTITPTGNWCMAGCDVAQVAAAGNPFVNSTGRNGPWDIPGGPVFQQGLNPNLFKNPFPFNQYNYPLQFRILKSPYDLSVSLNPNLFKNPVPFNQTDWTKPFRVPHAPYDLSVGLNLNLFKNPIPFLNAGPTSFPVLDFPVPAQPYNRALYTIIVSAPFINTQPTSFPVPDFPTPSQPYNQNLYTNPYPIQNLYTWSFGVADIPAPPPPLNINLFTNPVPFINTGPTSFAVSDFPVSQQPYNPNLYQAVVTAQPFNQTFWLPARQAPSAPIDFYNLVLFQTPEVLPFNQTDWSVPIQPKHIAAPDQSYNPNLFTSINPYPFQNVALALVPSRSFPLLDTSYNQALYATPATPLPFNTYDYPRAVQVQVAPFDLSLGLNANLFLNPIPSLNFDWTPPRHITPPPLDQSIGFQILNIPIVASTLIQRTLTGVGL
jgi:hypothetical protein